MATSIHLFGQEPDHIITPVIDSIYRNTIDYIIIKNELTRQQNEIMLKEMQLDKTLNALNGAKSNITRERRAIESELEVIDRHLDSLIPPRPEGPHPKPNIIDRMYQEGVSITGNFGLNLNQLALSNWAAGGETSSTGKAFASLAFVSKKSRIEQKATGEFAFGISRFSDKHMEKSDDKIDLSYAISKGGNDPVKFSMVSTFNTQFAKGFSYPNDSVVISGFFAPAYLTLSGGYTFKTKKENFQAYISPLAGKVTFVMIQELADQGRFGVTAAHYDEDSVWIPGENILAALGANIILGYKQKIGDNITFNTALNTYYNYSEVREDKLLKVDVNWETTTNFIINKGIKVILFVHLKYDHNTTFPVYETIEGVETVVDNVPKLQFKESLGIAITYSF